jgi:ribosome-associated protein
LKSVTSRTQVERAAPPDSTSSSTPLAGQGLEHARLSARVALENKASDVLILDLRHITPLFDYFVLATGVSRRQVHTLAEEIDDALHAEGETRRALEGYEPGRWVVLDYGDLVIHLFDPETRAYYGLEDLWADAPRVDF